MKLAPIWLIATTFSPAVLAEVPDAVQALMFERYLRDASDEFVYCLSVDRQDAAESLLRDLQRPSLTLVAASECSQNRNPREGGSIHLRSREKAMFLRLADFAGDAATGATVEFEAYHHGLRASGQTVRLELSDGEWRVAEVLRTWVA